MMPQRRPALHLPDGQRTELDDAPGDLRDFRSTHTESETSMRRKLSVSVTVLAVAVTSMSAGCAGPGPKLYPVSPVSQEVTDGGLVAQLFDTDANGRIDATVYLGADGLVRTLRWDTNEDGSFEGKASWPLQADSTRHLLIILDSIPFEMVKELRDHGRFRLFSPPSRIIAPFPVMTDVSLSEFFHMPPPVGVESQYYDGKKLTNGYLGYAHEADSRWLEHVDYHLRYWLHMIAYPDPHPWYSHELRRIRETFEASQDDLTVGYVVGTSALGAKEGRTGHQIGLIELDRFCQQLVHDTHGRIHITVMSDHGHNLVTSKMLPLRELLEEFGYVAAEPVLHAGDALMPAFGVVTVAAIHTVSPAAVARDVAGLEGVDLTMYADGDTVVVLSRDGRATIRERDGRFSYTPAYGDPLQLEPICRELPGDADGFIDDEELMSATVDHVYPDPLHRIWHAFHGAVGHTPDVFVAVKDGWHCGDSLMNKAISLAAAHGNLNAPSTYGFVMTTAGGLPPVLRMHDVAGALANVGVPVTWVTNEKDESVAGASPVSLSPAFGDGEVEHAEDTLAVKCGELDTGGAHDLLSVGLLEFGAVAHAMGDDLLAVPEADLRR